MGSAQPSATNLSISHDYGSIIAKNVRGRRNRYIRQVDVKNLFTIVKSVLLRDDAHANLVTTLTIDSTMAEIIRKLTCKLACSCPIKDVQEIVEEILGNHLSKYDWDAIMAMTLAAFAANYGAFRIFAMSTVEKNIQLFKNIALLKQLQEIPCIIQLLGEIDKVVMAAVKMIESALKLMELRTKKNAQILTSSGSVDSVVQAACYTIHAVVICASLITAPSNRFNANEEQLMLSNLMNAMIETTIPALHAEIKAISELDRDLKKLFEVFCNMGGVTSSIAAMLKALIEPDANGKSTLVMGNNPSIEVSFEQMKGENIYLLISGGYISDKEIEYIAELMKKDAKCQLVWIPISIDFERFSKIQSLMNWYTVRHPSQIRPATVKFIKETWMFQGQTILVPLGQNEPEFYSIDWLWARGSFPHVNSPLPPLPQLSLSYLLSDIYQLKTTAFKTTSPPVICLYGGEDFEWIKSFSKLLGDVGKSLNSKFQINVEFIYVSKSEGIDAENAEILSHLNTTNFGSFWKAGGTECWRFWMRVESYFREQIRTGTDMKKGIMKEALTLLSYNANHKGWVVFGQHGTDLKLAQATGNVAEAVLKQINKLYVKQNTSTAFIEALSAAFYIEQVKRLPHPCIHIMLPASIGDLGDCITCPICEKTMAAYRYHRCCV